MELYTRQLLILQLLILQLLTVFTRSDSATSECLRKQKYLTWNSGSCEVFSSFRLKQRYQQIVKICYVMRLSVFRPFPKRRLGTSVAGRTIYSFYQFGTRGKRKRAGAQVGLIIDKITAEGISGESIRVIPEVI